MRNINILLFDDAPVGGGYLILIFSAASRGSATALFVFSRSVCLQSASWRRRVTVEIVGEILQNNTKYLAGNPPKSSQNLPKNDPESMKKTSLERRLRRNAHLGGGRTPQALYTRLVGPFWSPKSQTNVKNAIPKIVKKRPPKKHGH